MSLNYRKISEEEDQMRNVLEKGEYPFLIKSICEKKTKSGQYDMLELELGFMDQNGRELTIKDWVVFMDEMAWKFRHLCATCGLLDRYNDGLIEAKDFPGKHGVAKLSIADYEKDGEMRKINRVADYIKPGNEKGKPMNDSSANDFHDDDITF